MIFHITQVIGHVGAHPEVTYTDQGTARTTFRVAVNRQWNDADGQPQTETEWIPILAWGAVAEIAGEYLSKGKRVYIAGRLHTHTWTADDTGEKRYRTEIVAQDLILLSPRNDQPDDEAEPDAPPSTTPARSDASRPQQRRRRQSTPEASSDDPDWDALGL